jgi:oligopeptide/dipeptide ABC transporter ATP-binding protein
VEVGPVKAIFEQPSHPYTNALLSAIPIADPVEQRTRQRIVLSGEIPDIVNPPPGCPFASRCPRVTQVCRESFPEFREHNGTSVACYHPMDSKRDLPMPTVAS